MEGFSIDEAGGSGFKKQPIEKHMLDCVIQVFGTSHEALLAAVAKRDRQVMDVHDSILALHAEGGEDISYTRTARADRTILEKMNLLFLPESIAENIWWAIGWTCDTRPSAVLTTLKDACAWMSTAWWAKMQKQGI